VIYPLSVPKTPLSRKNSNSHIVFSCTPTPPHPRPTITHHTLSPRLCPTPQLCGRPPAKPANLCIYRIGPGVLPDRLAKRRLHRFRCKSYLESTCSPLLSHFFNRVSDRTKKSPETLDAGSLMDYSFFPSCTVHSAVWISLDFGTI